MGAARKPQYDTGLVAYLHIPKTCGTTLASFLNGIYPSEAIYRIHRNGSSKQLGRNMRADRALRTELTSGQLRAIERANRYDIELYEFAKQLFDNAVAALQIDTELQRLRSAPVCEPPIRVQADPLRPKKNATRFVGQDQLGFPHAPIG